jgi:hypothetical protein
MTGSSDKRPPVDLITISAAAERVTSSVHRPIFDRLGGSFGLQP